MNHAKPTQGTQHNGEPQQPRLNEEEEDEPSLPRIGEAEATCLHVLPSQDDHEKSALVATPMDIAMCLLVNVSSSEEGSF